MSCKEYPTASPNAPTALEQRVDVDHRAPSVTTTTTRVPITDSAFELLSFSSDTQRPQLPANGREPRQNSHNYSIDSGGEGSESDTPLPTAFKPAGAKLKTPGDSSVGSSGSSQDGMIVRILSHDGHLGSPLQAELDVSGNASYGGVSIERSQLLANSHQQRGQSRTEGGGGGNSANIIHTTTTGGSGVHAGSHQKGGTFLEASSSSNHHSSFHAEDSLHASYGGSIISQSQILPPLPQGLVAGRTNNASADDVSPSVVIRRENSQLKLLGLTKQTRKSNKDPVQGSVRTTAEKLENVETTTRKETKPVNESVADDNQQRSRGKENSVDGVLTTIQQAEDWSVSRSRDEDEVVLAGATTNIAGCNHQEPVGQDVGSSILSGAATKDILSTESVTSSMSKEVSVTGAVASPLTGASLTGILTQVEATEPTQIGNEVVYVTGENLMGVRSRLIENDGCITEGGDNRFTQQREPCSMATSTAGGNSPPTRSLTQQPAASGSKHTNITYDGPIPDASSSPPNGSLLGGVNDDERNSDGDLLSFDLDSPIVSSKKDLKDVVTKHERASSDGSPIHKYTVETPPIFNATGGSTVKNGIASGPVSEDPQKESENGPASKNVVPEPEVETEHSTTAPTASNTTASPTPAPEVSLTINVVSGAATEAYSSPLHPISDSDRLAAPIQLESHRSTTSSEAESNIMRASGRHRRATATPTDSLPSWTGKEVETTKTTENGGMLDTLLQVEVITHDETLNTTKTVNEPAAPSNQSVTKDNDATPSSPPSALRSKLQTKIDAAKMYEKITKKVNRVAKTSIDVRVYAFATAPSSVGGSATTETTGSRVICVDATLRLCRKGGLIVFEQQLDIDAMLERMEFPVVRYPSGETLGGFKAADVMFCSSDLESSSVGIVLENRKNKVLMARLRQKHLQQVQQQAALLSGSTSSGRPPRSPIKSTTAEQNFPSSSVPPSLALSTSSSFLRSTTTATLASSTNEQQLLSSPTDATNLPTYEPKHTVSMTIRRSLTGGGTKSSSKNSSKKKKKKSTATLGVPTGGGLRAASLKRSASGTMTNMTGFMSGDEPPIPIHYRQQQQQQSLSSNQQQQTADKASLPSSFTAPSIGSGDQGFVGIVNNNNNGVGNNSPQSAQPLNPFSMSTSSSCSFNESTSSTNSRYKRYAVSDQEEVLELLIETSSVEAAQQLLKEVQALKGT